jgi:hypothetical protein
MDAECALLEAKGLGVHADNSPPSGAEVKNVYKHAFNEKYTYF